jgi:peroxiredoxin
MRIVASSILLSLACAALVNAQQLPRKAPEITVAEPDGHKTLLSSYKGKVVVLALVATTCPHCQKECEMLTTLYAELKPKGVQMLAIAFNDNAAVLVPGFIREHGIMFPVGSAPVETALGFLGFSVMDRYVVPQIAVIDRKGMIRAQTPPDGDPNLQDREYLRKLVVSLASEPAGPATSKAAPKTTSNIR